MRCTAIRSFRVIGYRPHAFSGHLLSSHPGLVFIAPADELNLGSSYKLDTPLSLPQDRHRLTFLDIMEILSNIRKYGSELARVLGEAKRKRRSPTLTGL